MRTLPIVLAAGLALVGCADPDETVDPQNPPANDAPGNNGGVADTFEPIEGPADGAWSSFRADAARTGYSQSATVGRTVAEAWRIPAINTTSYGAAKSSPSIADRQLFIGSDDARFTAIDPFDGAVLWEKLIEGTTQGIHGSATIGRDHVYIGAYNGTLYGFERESGEQIWEYTKGFQIGASPVLVPEHGRIYNTHEHSAQGGGWVVSVDARTGEEVWAYRIRAHPHSSVAIDKKNSMLFVGDNAAEVHGFDLVTGDKVWAHQLEQTAEDQSDVKTTPTVIEDRELVVVGAWSRMVHAFDATSGEVVWETHVGARIMGSTAYAPSLGIVFVGSLSPSSAIHALDVDTGEELWRTPFARGVMSSPAVSGDEDLIVVGCHDHNVYALDSRTGEIVWQYAVDAPVSSSPALMGNMVFVAGHEGDLVALVTE